MTPEQLQAVRAEKWRQKTNPILTLEEAEAWTAENGLGLFLPRKAQLPASAPSFVEATLGEPNATPAPAAIESAFALAERLFAAAGAIPLNLLGNVSEQPDFLASSEALPYVFALHGDRDWKRGPRGKTAPLVVETWKTLRREGVLTVGELQSQLGREVTEGAVLRALSELWNTLRVLPVYSAGEPTSWELFESRQQKAMQTGSGLSQGVAISALVSLYLDSVIAATSDEIETFLSPLNPRSRIREAVRGLEATRQLSSQPWGVQNILYITGGLPEFPEIEAAPAEEQAGTAGESSPRAERPFRERRSERAEGDRPPRRFDGERKPFAPREDRGEGRPRRDFAAGGPQKEWQPREGGERKSFGPRRAEGGAGFKRPFQRREEGGDSRPPRREFQPREGGERKSFGPRRAEGESGFKKPFRKREDGGDQGFGQRPPRREWQPREGGERKSFGPRRAEGGDFKKPFRKREEGGDSRPPRREWQPREGGERKSFGPRRTESTGGGFKKPFRKREEGDSQRPPRRDFAGRGEGGRESFRPRRTESAGDFKKPFRKREEGEGQRPPRRDFAARGPKKEWQPRGDGEQRSFRPRRTESAGGGEFKKTFRKREEGDFKPRRSGEERPRRAGAGFGGKRSSEGRPAGGGFKRAGAGKPGAGKSGAGKSFSRPGGKPGSRSSGGSRPPAKFGQKKPSFRSGNAGGKPSSSRPAFKRPGKRKKTEE